MKTTGTISEKAIDEAILHINRMDDDQIPATLEKIGTGQPDLLAFVISFTQDFEEQAQGQALFLFSVIYRAFETSMTRRPGRIKDGRILKRLEQNEAQVELVDPESLMASAYRDDALRQEHLFFFLMSALYGDSEDFDDDAFDNGEDDMDDDEELIDESESDDDDTVIPLTEKDKTLIFIMLKTVIEVMDSEMRRSFRRR